MRKRYIFYAVTDTSPLIIFDEVQMFSQARAAIKYLVGEVDSLRSCGCEKIERFS